MIPMAISTWKISTSMAITSHILASTLADASLETRKTTLIFPRAPILAELAQVASRPLTAIFSWLTNKQLDSMEHQPLQAQAARKRLVCLCSRSRLIDLVHKIKVQLRFQLLILERWSVMRKSNMMRKMEKFTIRSHNNPRFRLNLKFHLLEMAKNRPWEEWAST